MRTIRNRRSGREASQRRLALGRRLRLEPLEDRRVLATFLGTGGEIPDSGTLTTSISVADTALVSDVNVWLDISHTNVSDLDAFLIGPDGTRIELFTAVGGSGDNFTGTTLDDEAATSITSGSAPFTGSYQPEGLLASLDGISAQGSWQLEVTDRVKLAGKPRPGTLNSWSIDVSSGPELSIADVALTEGDSGTAAMVFTVTRSGDLSQPTSVDYATADGSATAGDGDYLATSGTLHFAAAQAEALISVDITGDTTIEFDESFVVNLVNATGGTVADGQAAGTILDDDAPVPIAFVDFSSSTGLNLIGDASIANGNTLRLTPAAEGMEGAAWFTEKQFVGVDWETTFDFNLNENFGDTGGSDGFTFVVQNYDPTYLVGGGGTLGYLELPNSVAIEFDTYQNTEVNDPSGSHISVHTNGTGPNGWDEALSLGSFSTSTIMDDASTHTAKIRYAGGTLSVFLDDLSAPVLEVPVDLAKMLELDTGKAWVGFTSATGGGWQNHDILNWTYKVFADIRTTVSISDVAVLEGDSGTSNLIFAMSRAGDTTGTTTVDWSTSDGTATAGIDYTAAIGQISFAAGEVEKTVTIAVNGDTVEEDAETLFINLANATGGVVADGNGTGSIINDDTSVSIADATATEGDTSLKFLGEFVADGSGGLSVPRDNVFGPDRNGDSIADLYVISARTDEILVYDGATGNFIEPFITGVPELQNPGDIAFSPIDGHLYASSAYDKTRIFRFDGQTGAFIDAPVSGVTNPLGITFVESGPDLGDLLIADRTTHEILRFDGTSLTPFVTAGNGGLNGPRNAVFGLDGDLYVSSWGTNQVLKYDGSTGNFLSVIATDVLASAAWVQFGDDGYLYLTGRTTDNLDDDSLSLARIDPSTGAVEQIITSPRLGWSFMVAPNGFIYASGNGAGNHVDLIGSGSLAAFTLSLSKPSGIPVTVDFSTADGTATTAGGDYSAVSGSVTFPPGVTTRTILVPTLDDTATESAETFAVNVSNAVGAAIADGQGIGTISDDDVTGDPNAMYVWDIGFESRSRGSNTDYRIFVDVRQDLDADLSAEASDPVLSGVAVTVIFTDASGTSMTFSGTTDSTGIFRSEWIKGLSSGDYRAEVTDLALAGLFWDPSGLLDATLNDDDRDGDGLPDELLTVL